MIDFPKKILLIHLRVSRVRIPPCTRDVGSLFFNTKVTMERPARRHTLGYYAIRFIAINHRIEYAFTWSLSTCTHVCLYSRSVVHRRNIFSKKSRQMQFGNTQYRK